MCRGDLTVCESKIQRILLLKQTDFQPISEFVCRRTTARGRWVFPSYLFVPFDLYHKPAVTQLQYLSYPQILNPLTGSEERKQKISHPGAERNAGNVLKTHGEARNPDWQIELRSLCHSASFNLASLRNQDNMKYRPAPRTSSRRHMVRNVGEAELLQVLQRRRRAMGEYREVTQTHGTPEQWVS